jgi:general secretion pathway protein E
MGIFELIPIDGEFRKMIHDGAGEHLLEAYARQSTPSIYRDGIRRVLQGETTVDELLRVTDQNSA